MITVVSATSAAKMTQYPHADPMSDDNSSISAIPSDNEYYPRTNVAITAKIEPSAPITPDCVNAPRISPVTTLIKIVVKIDFILPSTSVQAKTIPSAV
jgi:hypothetical protein